MKNWLKSFVHNVIVHPLMQFLPRDLAHEMHDRNANWAFGLQRYDELKLEDNDWLHLTKKLSRKYRTNIKTLDDWLGIYRLEWELESGLLFTMRI